MPAGMHDFMYLAILSHIVVGEKVGRRLKYSSIIASYLALIFIAATLMQLIDFRPPGSDSEFSIFLDAAVYSSVTFIFLCGITWLLRKGIINFTAKIKLLYGVFLTFMAGNIILIFMPVLSFFESHIITYDAFVYLMLYAFVLSCYRVVPFVYDRIDNLCNVLRGKRVPVHQGKK